MVLMEEIARRAGKLELQRFVVRNDSPCGGTIGPMLAAKLGLRFYCLFIQTLMKELLTLGILN